MFVWRNNHLVRSVAFVIVVACGLMSSIISGFAQSFLDSSWGAGFSKCQGAPKPLLFRAGNSANNVEATCIITCADDGDSFVYAVEYMNFALAPNTEWKSAHLEWFGAGAKRPGPNGQNEW